MDNKEILYEISLKYNTLKMYESTIEEMKKNNISGKSLDAVIFEKNVVEKELIDLLNPNTPTPEHGWLKNPSISNGNKFIEKMQKKAEYNSLYDIKKNFFDDIVKESDNSIANDFSNEINFKKPTYAEIQEKISDSQWISMSNFIVNFPKNKVNIDEWRVSSFYYTSGDIYVIVNDFAEKKDDGKYVILSQIIEDLYVNSEDVIGNIILDVVNNNGDTLYSINFSNCKFSDASPDSFTYESTELRKINLHFTYDNFKIIPPTEK